MEHFAKQLNASPWSGVISEVGIGLQFSASYMNISGASHTIIAVHSDYAACNVPHGMRAVSKENARRVARENLQEAKKNTAKQAVFGLAITGAHYTDRESHAWVYLATENWEAWMHLSTPTHESRFYVGSYAVNIITQFLSSCLLNVSWQKTIQYFNESWSGEVDVLYGPGLSDVERILLLRDDNALAYRNGEFQRVADLVRLFPMIYPGAFNPPTKRHVQFTGLFEISQKHPSKGNASIQDILHRVRMLDLENKAVLITRAPRMVDKYNILRQYNPDEERFDFLVGADAWNAVIAHHQYPDAKWLSEQMPRAKFIIMPRNGVDIENNEVSKFLRSEIANGDNNHAHVNSTNIRVSSNPGNHEHLTLAIADYIKRMELYKESTGQVSQ